MTHKTTAADELAKAPFVKNRRWTTRPENHKALPELEELRQAYRAGRYPDKSDHFIYGWCVRRFGLKISESPFLQWLREAPDG